MAEKLDGKAPIERIAAILLGSVNAPEQEIYRVAREIAALPAPSGAKAVAVKPLIWEDDHGVAGMGPYRLFKAETPLGRFVYGTDAEGSAYYHTASSGVMMVGDEVTAKRLAEASWEKAALNEAGKYAALSALAHPLPAEVGRVLEPFARESERWEPKGDVYWPDAVPFPASSISGIKIGDLRAARDLLSKTGRTV